MPINSKNQRGFHRTLYAGMLESVTVLKRGPNLRQGTVVALRMHQVRWGQIHRTGQEIQGEMTSNSTRTLHVSVSEMDRLGITYFSSLDRFVDKEGRHWQPEATTRINKKLLQQHGDVFCLQVDPPIPNYQPLGSV